MAASSSSSELPVPGADRELRARMDEGACFQRTRQLTRDAPLKLLLPHVGTLAAHAAALAPHVPALLPAIEPDDAPLHHCLPAVVAHLPELLPNFGMLLKHAESLNTPRTRRTRHPHRRAHTRAHKRTHAPRTRTRTRIRRVHSPIRRASPSLSLSRTWQCPHCL